MRRNSNQQVDYSKLNELLLSKDSGNQELYEYLSKIKQTASFNKQNLSNKWGSRNMKSYIKSVEDMCITFQDSREIVPLEVTESEIFRQVFQASVQIAELEEILRREDKELSKIIEEQKQIENVLSQQLKQNRQLLLLQNTINKINKQTSSLKQKSSILSLLNENLPGEIERLSKLNSNMKIQRKVLLKILQSKIIGEEGENQNQIRQQYANMQSLNQFYGSFKACVQERTELQTFLLNQMQQKQEFLKTLALYEHNYSLLKQQNQRLKRQIINKNAALKNEGVQNTSR